MPVTARLSRRFYDTFGEEIADELVGLLNQVGAAPRAEMRELFEEYHVRYRAELEQRLAESLGGLRGEMHEGRAGLRSEMQDGLSSLRGEMHENLSSLRGEMHAGFASLRSDMASMRADLMKWMFLFWVGGVMATVTLTLSVVGLLRS
mgnify:FL=1